jgi:hypothetical protein
MTFENLGGKESKSAKIRFPWRKLLPLAVALGAMIGAGVAAASEELKETELEGLMQKEGGTLPQVVRKIEETITLGDATYLQGLISTQAVLDRATAGVSGKDVDVVRKIFRDGTAQAWSANGPAKDYAGMLFRYLRVRTIHERSGLLFRSAGQAGALNYYLFVLAQPSPGTFQVVDIYTLGLSEFASDSLRRTYRHLVASFVGGETGSEFSKIGAEYVDNLQKIAGMGRLVREGNWQEALKTWETLPADVQVERGVLMCRVDAAERGTAEERTAAMDAWLKTFPDEMEMPLKIADYYIAMDRLEDAERLLRSVIEFIGGDSRMEFHCGQVAYRRKMNEKAWAKASSPDAKPRNAAAEAGPIKAGSTK